MAAWVVVTPLLGGAIAFLSRRPAAQVAATASGIVTMLLSFGVLWQVWIGGVQRLRVGGWGAPLGIEPIYAGLGVATVFQALGIAARRRVARPIR